MAKAIRRAFVGLPDILMCGDFVTGRFFFAENNITANIYVYTSVRYRFLPLHKFITPNKAKNV